MTSKTKEPALALTVEQAGKLLGFGRSKAYELARTGQIPVIRFGRSVRVPRAALEKMLAGVKAGAMKSAAYLYKPDMLVAQRVESRIDTRETLEFLLDARTNEALDFLTLCEGASGDVVLIRRSKPGASIDPASLYYVNGKEVLGRALICTRPHGAPLPEPYLSAATQIEPTQLSHEEADALRTAGLEPDAPAENDIRIGELDAFAQVLAGLFSQLRRGSIHVVGLDENGKKCGAVNPAAGIWYELRTAALEMYDRRLTPCFQFVLRPPVGARETDEGEAWAEVCAVSAKRSDDPNEFGLTAPDGSTVYCRPLLTPNRGGAIAGKKFPLVCFPGLPIVSRQGVIADVLPPEVK